MNTVEIANRRKLWYLVGKRLFAALFIIAGVSHFVATDFFLKIMPPYLPFHLTLVLVSGVIEIILGILLLVPRYSRLAAWGIIALLIAVFPANIHVYTHQELFPLPAIRPSAPATFAGCAHPLGFCLYKTVSRSNPLDRDED